MKKADVRLANIDTDLLTKIRFSVAFPGGFEPPTFRLGALAGAYNTSALKSFQSRINAYLFACLSALMYV